MSGVTPRTCVFSRRCIAASKPSIRPRHSKPDCFARPFATAVSDPAPLPRRRPTAFKDKLNAGPAFADFVGGENEVLAPEEALELKTAVVGPPGNRRQITRLPDWLKTPVPVGDNFKKIKNDLRGLNLHTGQ